MIIFTGREDYNRDFALLIGICFLAAIAAGVRVEGRGVEQILTGFIQVVNY